jgi:transposase
VTERTCLQRDAASVVFNLPNYHVIEAVDLPLGGRRVIVGAKGSATTAPSVG